MSAVRILWREFCDLSPAAPSVPRQLLPALVAVLVLRAVLTIVVLTPAGPLALMAMLGWEIRK